MLNASARNLVRSPLLNRYVRSAYNLTARAIFASQKKWFQINEHLFLARPEGNDYVVAYSCFNGEFDSAIEAAKPLQHNFIIDAGGYIGTAAIVFARAFPEATIVTLEPSSENFSILRRNVAPYANIVPINAALSTKVGWTKLVDPGEGHWGYSIVSSDHGGLKERTDLQEVKTTTIGVLCRKFDRIGIDLLKLDIEGTERDLMNEGHTSDARIVCVELHERLVPGCDEAFAKFSSNRTVVHCGHEKLLAIAGARPS